jgi:hypothetical protein
VAFEVKGPPIELDGGTSFYSSLPPRAAHLEDTALSTLQGRMEATKEHLIETFKRFEGKVIYPCALADLRSVLDLHKLFPNAQLVLNDLIDPAHISNVLISGERPSGTDAMIEYLKKRFVFDRTSEWRDRDEIKDLTFEVKRRDEQYPVFDVSFRIDTSSYNPNCLPEFLSGISRVKFEYRVTNLFNDDDMSSGIVFLRRPGWQGSLMKDAKLWERVSQLVGDNQYLLAATDQGYQGSTALISKSFEPLLIDPYIDQCRPALPLFKIGGAVSTQVFVKKPPAREMPYLT